VLTKAELDIRASAQPRYQLEMALLRWIYLRKLVSIDDLIAGKATLSASAPRASAPAPSHGPAPSRAAALSGPASVAPQKVAAAQPPVKTAPPGPPAGNASFKDAFLAEVRKGKVAFYNMVVAQARTIDVSNDRIEFTFSANQRALREQVEQNKTWLESIALQAGGRRVTVTATQDGSQSSLQSPVSSPQSGAGPQPPATSPESDRKAALKEQALADSGVQALLEVFPAEIRDVEEM
jgi:DNA polymerase III gamma/tau subunit